MQKYQKIFLTFFGCGLSAKAPGTIGTLGGLVSGYLIAHVFFSYDTLAMLLLFICVVGVFEINSYEKNTGIHDDKKIVIDEVAGIWLAMFMTKQSDFLYLSILFVIFRLLDIYKPSLIGRIDRNVKGGFGVMGDDLLAGFVTAICFWILRTIGI